MTSSRTAMLIYIAARFRVKQKPYVQWTSCHRYVQLGCVQRTTVDDTRKKQILRSRGKLFSSIIFSFISEYAIVQSPFNSYILESMWGTYINLNVQQFGSGPALGCFSQSSHSLLWLRNFSWQCSGSISCHYCYSWDWAESCRRVVAAASCLHIGTSSSI
jgi:hypothetical protein